MPAAGTDTKSLTSAWKKTNEQELFNSLKIEYGFSQALARSLVQLMHDHIETNYGNLRGDSQVIYHAVSMEEPPGKSLDQLRLVPVSLTMSHPEDAAILREQGVPGLRKHKLLRLILPYRGTIHDIGPSLTHKKVIIAKFLQGIPTPDIARMTQHTEEACDRYIKAFKKVRMLHDGKKKPPEIAQILGMSERLANEYVALIEEQRSIERVGNLVS